MSGADRCAHLILDRDGVLNCERTDGGWVREWAEFVWLDGAREALRRCAEAGVTVSVVTNQSCIGRGLVAAQSVDDIHEAMRREAERAGGRIVAVYVCPHAPDDGCDCRKPRPGLVARAVADSGIAREQTLLIGDDVRDLSAGRAAGVRVALVRTGKGERVCRELDDPSLPVFADVLDAVSQLIAPVARSA